MWSEEAKDSQDNTIRLFNPGGVLTGFETQNLHFCWFATSDNTGKTFRGVIDCICNGTSVDCRHTLHRLFDDGSTKSYGEMCYVWFKKWAEKFPAEAGEAKWVFDIVKGDLSEEALKTLQCKKPLPFSSHLLALKGKEYVTSEMEWEAGPEAAAPEAAAPEAAAPEAAAPEAAKAAVAKAAADRAV